jgi:hypothetical protein
MKQLIYITLLFIGFSAHAGNPSDSTTKTTQSAPLTVNGGTIRKVMGDRVYMKSTNSKVVAIKCTKNPKNFCMYVAKADGEEESGDLDPLSCPTVSQTQVPDPIFSQQFPNAQKSYVGIPQTSGGIRYYEVNSATMECTPNDEQFAVIVTLDPEIEIEE